MLSQMLWMTLAQNPEQTTIAMLSQNQSQEIIQIGQNMKITHAQMNLRKPEANAAVEPEISKIEETREEPDLKGVFIMMEVPEKSTTELAEMATTNNLAWLTWKYETNNSVELKESTAEEATTMEDSERNTITMKEP